MDGSFMSPHHPEVTPEAVSAGPLILERADAAEQRGCLDDDVVEALRDGGLFGALVPSDFGGLDLTIPDVTEVVRTLSTYDASVGWTRSRRARRSPAACSRARRSRTSSVTRTR